MKKIKIQVAVTLAIFITLAQSCGSKREPGKTYMPDMSYSRTYEAYDATDLNDHGINFIAYPVEGTIKRGDLFPYSLQNDSNGYKMSAEVKDPLPPLDNAQMAEAERLFNVNCAICHGPKLDAQGPLAAGGKIPAVANLTLEQYVNMPVGTMFHSITYGKGYMGSYASQLTRKERWMVIQYVKGKQHKTIGASGVSKSDSTKAPSGKSDSTISKK
ncbi:MAG: cytochrome c [Ginsengibacter sp.]